MSAAKPTVWVSRIMMDSTLIKPFSSDLFARNSKEATEAVDMNNRGFALPAERFPKELYYKKRSTKAKHQPDIFKGGSFWIVSEAVAGVMRQFDLGG